MNNWPGAEIFFFIFPCMCSRARGFESTSTFRLDLQLRSFLFYSVGNVELSIGPDWQWVRPFLLRSYKGNF